MTITPKLDGFVKADGSSLIFIYIYDPATRRRAEISTGYHVPRSDWKGSSVDRKRLNAITINSFLKRMVLDLEEHAVKTPGITPLQLKEWYGSTRGTMSPAQYFRHYIELCQSGKVLKKTTREQLTPGYIKTLRVTARIFDEYEKRHGMTFEGINEAFYNRLVTFMRNEMKLNQNTIGKAIKSFKVICAHAYSNNVHTNLKFRDYVVTTVKAQKIRLTPEEVSRIVNLDLTDHPELKPEQDRFAVAYNLMLRFGDSITISENNIAMKDGKPFLRTFTQKTRKEVLLPIQKHTYGILKRNKFQLRGINQVSNRHLKKLGMLAGINEPVTITEFIAGKKRETVYKKWQLIETHTTRRSAARNLFDAGLAPEVIQVLGGWSTLKQMLEYIDIDLEYAASKAAEHPFFK